MGRADTVRYSGADTARIRQQAASGGMKFG